MAKTCTSNVEKYKKARVADFTPQTLAYVFSKELLNLKKDVKVYGIKPNDNPQTSKIDGGIGKTNCLKLCKLYVNWCEKHNYTAPSYMPFNGHKIDSEMWAYATARMLVTFANTGKLPAKTLVSYKPFYIPPKPTPKPAPAPKKEESYSEKVFNYFVSRFGSVSSIDEALEKVQDCGYSGYYDDKLTNWETIDGLADDDGEKPNCTDIHHVFWHLGIVMGYDVRAIHVWCVKSDVGHVRLDFNRGEGWFSRDASCVANGGDINEIWCSSGEFLAENPEWFLENLYR